MELNTFFDLLHRHLMKYAIFNLKFFNEKSFHAKRRSTNRGCQKDTQPHRQKHHGNVFFSKFLPCPHLLTMSPFLLIAVFQAECSFTLTDHCRNLPRKMERSKTAVAENNLLAPSKLTLTTIFAIQSRICACSTATLSPRNLDLA